MTFLFFYFCRSLPYIASNFANEWIYQKEKRESFFFVKLSLQVIQRHKNKIGNDIYSFYVNRVNIYVVTYHGL